MALTLSFHRAWRLSPTSSLSAVSTISRLVAALKARIACSISRSSITMLDAS